MIAEIAIACADIGSVAKHRFGWSVRQPRASESETGNDISVFAAELVDILKKGVPLAVGFECPLFVPIREDPNGLTGARSGEGSRPWSASAGCGALAVVLTETAWILRNLQQALEPNPPITFDWSRFQTSGGLFLWEAFVSGRGKSSTHTGDAELAVSAFARTLPDPMSANIIKEGAVLSLIGAGLLWAGWSADSTILREPCLVIAA